MFVYSSGHLYIKITAKASANYQGTSTYQTLNQLNKHTLTGALPEHSSLVNSNCISARCQVTNLVKLSKKINPKIHTLVQSLSFCKQIHGKAVLVETNLTDLFQRRHPWWSKMTVLQHHPCAISHSTLYHLHCYWSLALTQRQRCKLLSSKTLSDSHSTIWVDFSHQTDNICLWTCRTDFVEYNNISNKKWAITKSNKHG